MNLLVQFLFFTNPCFHSIFPRPIPLRLDYRSTSCFMDILSVLESACLTLRFFGFLPIPQNIFRKPIPENA